MSEDALIDPIKLRRFVEAREKRDEAKVTLENAEKEYRELEAEVWEEFEESPLTGTLKIDLGDGLGEVGFLAQETHFGRIIDSDAALEYFENRALVEEYTEPKITMARVNELVRDRIEQGESMPPGIDFYTRRPVKISRKKK